MEGRREMSIILQRSVTTRDLKKERPVINFRRVNRDNIWKVK